MPKHKKQPNMRGLRVVLAAVTLACLAGACLLIAADREAEEIAGAYTEDALRAAEQQIPGETAEQAGPEEPTEETAEPMPAVGPWSAGEEIPLEEEPAEEEPVEEEDDMSGYSYTGILTIPAIDVKLAVYNEYDRLTMKHGAFRYYGSVSGGNLVIGAHNYTTWFGKIHDLQPGDTAVLKDPEGNEHTYTVTEVLTIAPTETDVLVGGDDWSLTLFTCTPGGKSRVAVRFS